MKRRGSALLVVLGMLAFMVVSAVAFSAYMRYSRLPSSYLRRASASRHLVKAALAQAIDVVDKSIGDDLFPGMGDAGEVYYDEGERQSRGRNFWFERCFMGTNGCVSPAQTVSTLTLEGLAYLPPPLINEARYYSRRSLAAMWHPFAYDSGRFAFSAFDVSDCLDVNKMFADFGRDSSDMGRISLSYALEDADHSGYQVQPSAWDSFMERFRDEEGRPDRSKVPLVSLADFNLAANKSGLLETPFCRAMKQGKNVRFVDDEAGAYADLQRGLSIVTDSWFPQTNAANEAATIDLSRGSDQPLLGFGNDTADRNEATFDRLAQQSNKFLNRYVNEISMPEVVQLYDYLDRDGIPTSLAFPTTERAPMVTGVSLEGALSTVLTPQEYDTPETSVGGTAVKYHIKKYTLKVSGDLTAMAGAVFPFKYQRGAARSFRAQAFVSVVFAKDGADQMRFAADNWATRPNWSDGSDRTAALGIFANNKPSGFWIRSSPKSFSAPTKVLTEQEALLNDLDLSFGQINVEIASTLPANSQGLTGVPEENCTMRIIQKKERRMMNGVPTWIDAGEPVTEFGALPALGNLSASENFTANAEYKPIVQLWVRITDPQVSGNANAVDLVPACAGDDASPSMLLAMAEGSARRCALRFTDASAAGAGSVLAFSGTELTGGGICEITPKAYLVDDPRFNYAPENFWAASDLAGDFKTEWYERQRSAQRDGDIFMTTSDAGYMQSPYEIAHLLRITGLDGTSDWGCLAGSGYDGRAATSLGDTPADAAMWRTYTQYEVENRRDRISRLGILTGSKGFRMTPYSSSRDTMMAVFANTPLDWWAASTNDQQDASGTTKQSMMGSLAEAQRYTFSRHAGAQAQVDWEDLRELAEKVRTTIRNSRSSWEDTWDNLGWDGGELRELLGVDMGVDLHSVDRKFLHGYWRECFANRQQLFLIFVRAEPMMMGGGALGQTPPQLGARAVALVWRDPNAPRPTSASRNNVPTPHRTRILFYRQFD